MSERKLPPWRNEWSDGCTAAPDRGWWGDHRECCVAHDASYYLGGSQEDRLRADRVFYECLLAHGMPRLVAWLYHGAVRAWGHPRFRRPGVSWAFGGDSFQFSEAPATEDPELATETRPW